MLEIFKKSAYLLLGLIILTFLIRIINYSFPAFTSDEARVAYRAFTLSHFGKDELGRVFPLLFNSLTDYQFPVTSYLTSFGVFVFGKNDFGVRIPLIILGVLIVILTYKISQIFSEKKRFRFISILVLIFSPALVFLSRVPNDSIVLSFFVIALFYLLLKNKLNTILILLVIILSLATSKFAWFIIAPFIAFTLFFYRNDLSTKTKNGLLLLSLILVILTLGLYLQVPQSKRSFSENIFSIFSSSTIKNGINRSRGQGIEFGWPNYLEVGLFNKSFFPFIGFMHWLSNLQPSVYFGQVDNSGQLNFSQGGALSKVLIIPFVLGVTYLIRQGRKKDKLLLVYLLILTFPAIFMYPNFSQDLVILTLPFMAFIIAFGFIRLNQRLSLLIISVMVLELMLSILYLSPDKRNTDSLRPSWVKEMVIDIYSQSFNNKIIVSDDIVRDVISFIEWYNPVNIPPANLNVSYPYKYHQSSLRNITLVGSENKPFPCEKEGYSHSFLSKRDKDPIENAGINIVKTYRNNLNQEVAYLLEKGLCIK